MPKFFGNIGFAKAVEDPEGSGIYKNKIVPKKYRGDMIKNVRRSETGDTIIDNITLSNQLSIVSDPYIRENIGYIVYVEYMGTKWKVTSVEVKYPRLILTLGGVYNGTSAQASRVT